MKSKIIKFEDKDYEIRSFGFFKANRILLGTLVPVFGDISASISKMIEGDQDINQMVALILSDLKIDVVEDIMKTLLSNIYVDGEKLKEDDIDDYELGIELLQESIILNYSSLGKLMRKLLNKIELPTTEEEEEEETP